MSARTIRPENPSQARSPFGNPIQGEAAPRSTRGERHLGAPDLDGRAVVTRICEWAQENTALMRELQAAGVGAGRHIVVLRDRTDVVITGPDAVVRLPRALACGIYAVKPRATPP